MLTAIVIDDDQRNRKILDMMIKSYCRDDVAVTASTGDAEEAYRLILAENPDLLFIDIELSSRTAFDLLLKLPDSPFHIIFVTSYDKYLMQAIRFSGMDYILKPVDIGELVAAVKKASNAEKKKPGLQVQNLLNLLTRPGNMDNHLAIPSSGDLVLLPIKDIIYCEANKDHTHIHSLHLPVIISPGNLNEYEELLTNYMFCRVHQSYIINRQFVKQYIKGEDGELLLTNNQRLPVSRHKKQQVMRWIGI